MQITENLEPVKEFLDDLKGKIAEKYNRENIKVGLADPHEFKLNEYQFEGIW